MKNYFEILRNCDWLCESICFQCEPIFMLCIEKLIQETKFLRNKQISRKRKIVNNFKRTKEKEQKKKNCFCCLIERKKKKKNGFVFKFWFKVAKTKFCDSFDRQTPVKRSFISLLHIHDHSKIAHSRFTIVRVRISQIKHVFFFRCPDHFTRNVFILFAALKNFKYLLQFFCVWKIERSFFYKNHTKESRK